MTVALARETSRMIGATSLESDDRDRRLPDARASLRGRSRRSAARAPGWRTSSRKTMAMRLDALRRAARARLLRTSCSYIGITAWPNMSMRSVTPRVSWRGTSGVRCLRYCMCMISDHSVADEGLRAAALDDHVLEAARDDEPGLQAVQVDQRVQHARAGVDRRLDVLGRTSRPSRQLDVPVAERLIERLHVADALVVGRGRRLADDEASLLRRRR